MAYVRAALSGLAALLISLVGPGLVADFWGMNQQKTTGLGAIAGGLLESILSPLFWILAISFFALFFKASRLNSNALRVVLFWTPTVAISTMGVGLFSLFAYAWLHFRNG